jgi:hypothetical protein
MVLHPQRDPAETQKGAVIVNFTSVSYKSELIAQTARWGKDHCCAKSLTDTIRNFPRSSHVQRSTRAPNEVHPSHLEDTSGVLGAKYTFLSHALPALWSVHVMEFKASSLPLPIGSIFSTLSLWDRRPVLLYYQTHTP